MKKKTGVKGRPRLGKQDSVNLTVRIPAEVRVRYEKAAAKLKLSLSAWVRRTLDNNS